MRGGAARRVLACRTAAQDCTVLLPEHGALQMQTSGAARSVPLAPYPDRPAVEGGCLAAFDLGTTSIVCYLLDAQTGMQLTAQGMQNPQSAYGADVIARANYVLTGSEPAALRSCALDAMNRLLARAAAKAGRRAEQTTLLSIAGNTVMHHILLGLPLEQLVRAPYTPYAKERRVLSARALGLDAHPDAIALLAPVIGGFVGADTAACLSATAFDQITHPALLLDIGTNGELVCTDGTRRVCCSTAAGPAFEGANISCGMRAERGAIDRVWLEDGVLRYSVIGDAPARGICGSGLIDLVALLVRTGTIDASGRFCDGLALSDRLITSGDQTRAFRVTESGGVTLSQKDVRELQLGKAAIRAGIRVLLGSLSLEEAQIRRVLLAGAFGAHLSAGALCDIGLLPEAFRGRIESIGNAAGEGAKLYARSAALFEQSEALAGSTEYIELTLSPAFSEAYVDAMPFPEQPDQESTDFVP